MFASELRLVLFLLKRTDWERLWITKLVWRRVSQPVLYLTITLIFESAFVWSKSISWLYQDTQTNKTSWKAVDTTIKESGKKSGQVEYSRFAYLCFYRTEIRLRFHVQIQALKRQYHFLLTIKFSTTFFNRLVESPCFTSSIDFFWREGFFSLTENWFKRYLSVNVKVTKNMEYYDVYILLSNIFS